MLLHRASQPNSNAVCCLSKVKGYFIGLKRLFWNRRQSARVVREMVTAFALQIGYTKYFLLLLQALFSYIGNVTYIFNIDANNLPICMREDLG